MADTYKDCLNVAACVCAKDGIISEEEESKLYELTSGKFPSLNRVEFDSALDDFFYSSLQIEDYLVCVVDEDLRKFTMTLCTESASADGLDLRENIALKKVIAFWRGS